MARIAGVNLPNQKRLEIGLTYIYGIGQTTAQKICTVLELDPNEKVKLYGAYNYDSKFDVLRAPMTVKSGDVSLEQFTIGFVNVSDTRATLTMAWERTLATIDLAVAK